MRRWLHELDWVWKRAKLSAKDDDPQRVEKLARIRWPSSRCGRARRLFFADELDISLLPKVGYQWMPKGAQVEVMTPGTNEKRYLAGALEMATGNLAHCVWYRKTTGLFLDLLDTLDRAYPATGVLPPHRGGRQRQDSPSGGGREVAERRIPGSSSSILPTYCPKANPIERAFGDVHDKCTRNHTRKRMWHLVQDVKQHLHVNGPWPYVLSDLYYTPEVTAAVEALGAAETSQDDSLRLAA